MHPGMAAGAEHHEPSVVAGVAVMNIQIMSGLAPAAGPAVALESGIPVASKEKRRIPSSLVTSQRPG